VALAQVKPVRPGDIEVGGVSFLAVLQEWSDVLLLLEREIEAAIPLTSDVINSCHRVLHRSTLKVIQVIWFSLN